MKHTSNIIKHVPNALSIARFLLIPFLAYLAWTKNYFNFGLLLAIYASTDCLDGYFARKFNVSSEFGAKLDTLADNVGNSIIIFFVFWLFPEFYTNYLLLTLITFLLYIVILIQKVIKLKNIAIHLYSGKISQIFFLSMICYFSFFGFNSFLYYVWILISVIHTIESLLATHFFTPTSDTKHIFELMKQNIKR